MTFHARLKEKVVHHQEDNCYRREPWQVKCCKDKNIHSTFKENVLTELSEYFLPSTNIRWINIFAGITPAMNVTVAMVCRSLMGIQNKVLSLLTDAPVKCFL